VEFGFGFWGLGLTVVGGGLERKEEEEAENQAQGILAQLDPPSRALNPPGPGAPPAGSSP